MADTKLEMNDKAIVEETDELKDPEVVSVDPTSSTYSADATVTSTLKEYGVTDDVIKKIVDDLGVENMDDLASLEVDDLVGAGVKLAKARKLVTNMKTPTTNTTSVAPPASVVEARTIPSSFDVLLPEIPTDDSWLNALKTGGILKIDESSYIAAIRAALADRAGLYDVPEALAKAMEKYADETEEQVDPTFFSLRKSLTRRTYGDIFAAIDGLDGSFITENRRKEFLQRIRETLWPAIAESYRVLQGWYETYKASFADPSMILSALSGGPLAATMADVPDTAIIHDAGDTLVDSINRVFRGTGVQVAAALAYDANVIRKTMEDSRLPSMIGAKNREMMLKKIGTNVSSNYIRLEQNLVKYVLAFTKHDTITSDVEVSYFIALFRLGNQINWTELGGANPTTSGVFGVTGKALL